MPDNYIVRLFRRLGDKRSNLCKNKNKGDYMFSFKVFFISSIFVCIGWLPQIAFSSDLQSCGSGSKKTGKSYKINGSEINVRKGPGTNFKKIINKKASDIFKTTHYITVDNSVTVFEECSKGKWSKIRVTKPDYLSQSHRGWVASKFLRGKKWIL